MKGAILIALGVAVVGTVLGIWGLLIAMRAARQVNCLRYCYLDLREWAAGELVRHGDEPTELDFAQRAEYHAAVMNRAGLPRVSARDLTYAVYDEP